MCSKKVTTELLELIDNLISGNISATKFEDNYIVMWRIYRDFNAQNEIDNNTKIYIDRVFTAVDLYYSDPEIRDEYDFDEDNLLEEIIKIKNGWELLKNNK
ncbi:colicin immunity domain-containing protein [Proteus vulgaris]|uniref:colicin immunity domain-containing protein n=1 Tax=Proteus vulgaris TaxID=585 RepID=UPI00235EF1D4|nr:colicin immunity domain-containing protein [Proteus vulgaris]MDS0790448.1 colicin immunity domain-containing protein [Proteus vulgaris]